MQQQMVQDRLAQAGAGEDCPVLAPESAGLENEVVIPVLAPLDAGPEHEWENDMQKLIMTRQEYQRRIEGKLPFQDSLDLEQHEREGRFPKRKDCAVCQQADGPVHKHRTVEEEDKGMHTLHVQAGRKLKRTVSGVHAGRSP